MSTNDESHQTIDLAVSMGFISAAQASFLKEELEMFPIGGSVTSYMLRKGLLTPDQAQRLEEGPGPESAKDSGAAADGVYEIEIDLPPMQLSPVQAPPVAPAEAPPGARPAPKFVIPPLRPAESSPSASAPAAPIPPQQSATPIAASASTRQEPPARPSIADALSAARQAMQVPTRSGGATASASASHGVSASPQLRELFKMGRERGCSDLHLTVGKPPYLRQEGKIFFMPEQPLTAAVTKELIFSVLKPEEQQKLGQERQLDFSFEVPQLGRYRANVYYQRLGLEGEFRFIPSQVPTLKDLGLPGVLEKLTTYPQGLNLVTGPGGCGKTTTVAAMLEFINASRHEHIITVEDPVEYVLQPKACQVTQREVGTHTNTFADALRTALRQDPDVIMIGELRDLETTSIAITAAETGHLVFGTLHTAGAIRTVARILDVYPPSQRQQICMMVAESLRGIISQQLLPRKDGQGRVCAMEILVVTTGVSQVIKEGKTHQLVSHMQSGRKLGMKSMDDALMELAQSGAISGNVAYAYSENKPAFELMRTSS